MLAQLSLAPEFARLPRAPIAPYLFLENPWPLAAALGALALASWIWLRGRKARLPISAGCIAAAAGVVLLASQVTTTREELTLRTRRLIEAMATADHATVRSLTAEGGYARAYGRWERDDFLRMIETAAANGGRYSVGGASFRVLEYRIRETRAHVESAAIAKTQVAVTGQADEGPPTPTWWELDWDREADGQWRVRSVRLLWDMIGGNHRDR